MDLTGILYYFVIGSVVGKYIKNIYYTLLDSESKNKSYFCITSGIYLSIISNDFFKNMNIYILFFLNILILFLLKKISYINAKETLSIALGGTLYIKYLYSMFEILKLRINPIIISGIVILCSMIILLEFGSKKIT